MNFSYRNLRKFNYGIVALLMILVAFSCFAISGVVDSNMPSQAWFKQLVFAIIGFFAMIFLAFYDYRDLRKFCWWIYGIALVLHLAVFHFPPINHAHSWIPFSFFNLQPSEFAKIALIVATATWMANMDEKELPDFRLRSSWPVLVLLLPQLFLTNKEPALGQALVLAVISITQFMVFTKPRCFATITVAVFTVGTLLVMLPMFFQKQAMVLVNILIKHNLLHGYQANRILTWLDPTRDLLGEGYNVHQAQIAIGSGQMFGGGIHRGFLSIQAGVPNQWTDYVFSSVAEQFGFIGSSVLSYGGSSVVINFMLIGIVLSEGIRQKRHMFFKRHH